MGLREQFQDKARRLEERAAEERARARRDRDGAGERRPARAPDPGARERLRDDAYERRRGVYERPDTPARRPPSPDPAG
ncbi:hypothetical protein [Streptomyces sp. CAU 1734]|uniref:hypothetical protein n=1 Tax=Streptomyces sp. CAU 1734 TaxID=3140360 RepID=UPI003261405A